MTSDSDRFGGKKPGGPTQVKPDQTSVTTGKRTHFAHLPITPLLEVPRVSGGKKTTANATDIE